MAPGMAAAMACCSLVSAVPAAETLTRAAFAAARV